MKNSSFKIYALFLAGLFMVSSCTVTTEDDTTPDPSISVTGADTFGWIYSDLIIEGAGLDANCSNTIVTLTKDGTATNLDINDCTATAITAFIPSDMPLGTYTLTADVDGTVFTSFGNDPAEVEVKTRPVIFPLPKTEFTASESFEITGLNLLNQTMLDQNDPLVWIMKSGYTNTVSDITVAADGKSATIVLHDSLDPDDYTFKITTDEWSNEWNITIVE